MSETYQKMEINPRELIITNPNLDPDYIGELVEKIRSQEIHPTDLGTIFVGIRDNRLYVNEGNHRAVAFRIAAVPAIVAEVYSIEE